MRVSRKTNPQELLNQIEKTIEDVERSKTAWETAKDTGKPWTYLSSNPKEFSKMTVGHIIQEIAKTLSDLEKDER